MMWHSILELCVLAFVVVVLLSIISAILFWVVAFICLEKYSAVEGICELAIQLDLAPEW
jgi:hypothetical protein